MVSHPNTLRDFRRVSGLMPVLSGQFFIRGNCAFRWNRGNDRPEVVARACLLSFHRDWRPALMFKPDLCNQIGLRLLRIFDHLRDRWKGLRRVQVFDAHTVILSYRSCFVNLRMRFIPFHTQADSFIEGRFGIISESFLRLADIRNIVGHFPRTRICQCYLRIALQ